MSISELIRNVSPIIKKINHHPFNRMLFAGSLPDDLFKHYLRSDAYYLSRLGKVLQVISVRCDDVQEKRLFQHLSHDIVRTEQKIHQRYLNNQYKPTFFYNPSKIHKFSVHQVVYDHTNHLWSLANNAPLAIAIASCTPCFWVYNQLGNSSKTKNQTHSSRYHLWIASYTSPKFTNATNKILQVLETHLQNDSCCIIQNDIAHAFIQSTQFELNFFNAVLSHHQTQSNTMCFTL